MENCDQLMPSSECSGEAVEPELQKKSDRCGWCHERRDEGLHNPRVVLAWRRWRQLGYRFDKEDRLRFEKVKDTTGDRIYLAISQRIKPGFCELDQAYDECQSPFDLSLHSLTRPFSMSCLGERYHGNIATTRPPTDISASESFNSKPGCHLHWNAPQ